MPGRLQNKTAIVTGSGSGFGAGIAKKFVEEGANVLVWDINPTTPSEVAKQLDPTGKQTVPFVGDVTSPADWDRALGEVLAKWEGLDVVVNNAGVVHVAMPSILVRLTCADIEERWADWLSFRFQKSKSIECGGLM